MKFSTQSADKTNVSQEVDNEDGVTVDISNISNTHSKHDSNHFELGNICDEFYVDTDNIIDDILSDLPDVPNNEPSQNAKKNIDKDSKVAEPAL